MAAALGEVARRERLAPATAAFVPRQRSAPAADDDTRVA
jgi:hypothetical protein